MDSMSLIRWVGILFTLLTITKAYDVKLRKKRDGNSRTKNYKIGDHVTLQCSTNSIISIEYAEYKKTGWYGCYDTNAKQNVADECDGKQQCQFTVGSAFFGSACRRFNAKLKLRYTCIAGNVGCDSLPCLNGGTCNEDGNGYTCTCDQGYSGDNCDTDIDECDPRPCLNGGLCTDNINGYTCTCKYGYWGDTCENEPDFKLWGELSAKPFISNYDPLSPDRMLKFECDHWIKNEERENFTYDVIWEIDGDEIIKFCDLNYTDISSSSVLEATDWINRPRKMGFNCAPRVSGITFIIYDETGKFGQPNNLTFLGDNTVKCSIRARKEDNDTSNYLESKEFFAGIKVWPLTLTISSGSEAYIYLEITVPVACVFNDTVPCKVYIEMFDFNEQFPEGSSTFCNESIDDLTRPSLCGLLMDGWRSDDSPHVINVTVPGNAVQGQEHVAILKLQTFGASHDFLGMWNNYRLPEVQIRVVDDEVSVPWYWDNGYCYSIGDPCIMSFDYIHYTSRYEGEFLLYRHKTKPIEVHTIQRRVRYRRHYYRRYSTENCAVAVRAASDVFMIYGCGRRGKWEIHRSNCDSKNEYLIVFKKGSRYEIILPTGSKVYIWIARNRRVNVLIMLSHTDRDQSEGLCGNWNWNRNDDFTTREGQVVNHYSRYYRYIFIRSWSVPLHESLFIENSRTEMINLAYYYCTCLGTVLGVLSPDVDCSWRETLPLCPLNHWSYEACKIRQKRDAHEEDSMDASEDVVSLIEHEVEDPEWTDEWNEDSAKKACMDYFNESAAFKACAASTDIDTGIALSSCVLSIKELGTDEFIADSLEAFTSQCMNEVRTNITLRQNDVIYDSIVSSVCPNDCRYEGKKAGDCVEGKCVCYADYAGEDCGNNKMEPPTVSVSSPESTCDLSKGSCTSLYLYGDGLYSSDGMACRFQHAELKGSTIEGEGNYISTNAAMTTFAEVKCEMPNTRRKKRSTSSPDTIIYLISVTNNGVNFSSPVIFVVYDATCKDCIINDTQVICSQKDDVCIVGNSCYPSGNPACTASPGGSRDSNSSHDFLWLIGVAIGGIGIVILLALLIRLCVTNSKISPLCGTENEVYEKGLMDSSLSLQNIPPKHTAWK